MADILLGCMGWTHLFMKIITDYDQIQVSALQSTRLYLQGRPLLSLWSRKRRNKSVEHNKIINCIDHELDSDFIAIDCAGWYFANNKRNCTAIELHNQSSRYWNNVYYEYDYLTWHPDYLPQIPVLAYYSSYFKYCDIEDFITFCDCWAPHHPKLLIAVDPTKIKFNYFKFRLLDVLSQKLPYLKFNVLYQTNFELLFTVK